MEFNEMTLKQYLEELSSEKPVPGGGSVSAYVASLAMGLSQMVGRIALGRKRKENLSPKEIKDDEQRRRLIDEIVRSLEKTKQDAFQIVNLDPKVYQEVMKVWGEPAKREESLENSFRLQADLALLVLMAREWNKSLADTVAGSIKNDLVVSAGLYEAAFHGAYHTAAINAHYMEANHKRRAEQALEELKTRFEKGKAHAGS